MNTAWCLSVAAIIVSLSVFNHAADTGGSSNGVSVKVLGRSGKIMVAQSATVGGVAGNANRVTVEFDSLTEVDASGNAVGTTGSTKHSFNTFANQDFWVSAPAETTLQGLRAVTFKFNATLSGLTSALNVDVYVFQEGGNLTYGGELQNVTTGDVKFSVGLRSWQWCAPCTKGQTQQTGVGVLLTITLKGKGAAQKQAGAGLDTYGLGASAEARFSKKVQIDGSWQDMKAPYPKLTIQGSKQMFTTNYPKFTKDALYDPIISYTTPPVGAASPSAASRWLVVLIASLCSYLSLRR